MCLLRMNFQGMMTLVKEIYYITCLIFIFGKKSYGCIIRRDEYLDSLEKILNKNSRYGSFLLANKSLPRLLYWFAGHINTIYIFASSWDMYEQYLNFANQFKGCRTKPSVALLTAVLNIVFVWKDFLSSFLILKCGIKSRWNIFVLYTCP